MSLPSLLEANGDVTYVLGFIFLVAMAFSLRKLWKLMPPGSTICGAWNIKMILCASIAFSCFVRALSFATLSALAIENVDINSVEVDSTANTGIALLTESDRDDVKFYNNAIAALFVTGDFTFLSVYMLLVVVTIETLQITRQHLYSNVSIRRLWMIMFLVLNSSLYLIQICLFLALFLLPGTGQDILAGINLVVAVVNFSLPMALVLAYWVLTTCVYSGFPFLSIKAQRRWQALWGIMAGWSVSRVCWGGLSVFSSNQGWSNIVFVDNDWVFAVTVASTFILLELLPIAAVLGMDLNDLLYHSDPVTAEEAEGGDPKRASLMGVTPGPSSGHFPAHALAAAAAAGVVPRRDVLAGMADEEAGEGGSGGGDLSGLSLPPARGTPEPQAGRGVRAGTGAGHDIMVSRVGRAALDSPGSGLGQVQLRVSFDSQEGTAFDEALAE